MRTPPTPEETARRRSTNKKVALGCLLPIGLLMLLVIVIGVTTDSSENDDKAAADAPSYKVVDQDPSGNKRNVVVEVGSTNSLRAVFDDVTKGLTEEAGYYVMINCSTGGTEDVDNRLANGQYANGRMGAATTGLDEGKSEFSVNKDRVCPVDPKDAARQQADREAAAKAAGIPPVPTGAERQELLDALAQAAPDTVTYEDKAIDAARNQCSAINGGSNRLDWLASQRFTYKDVTTTEAQGKKINDALKASGFCTV